MAEPDADHSLSAECLAAMIASMNAYPCDLLAPKTAPECTLPDPLPDGPQTPQGPGS